MPVALEGSHRPSLKLQWKKVFWFFFSKRNRFRALLIPLPGVSFHADG
jgi:hypothetical protein